MGCLLGLKEWQDWYEVSYTDFKSNKGIALLLLHDGSIYDLLSLVYAEYQWDPARFRNTPTGTLRLLQALTVEDRWQCGIGRELMSSLAETREFITYNEFHKMSANDLLSTPNGGALMRSQKSSVLQSISFVYPTFKWAPWLFPSVPRHDPYGLFNTSRRFWDDLGNQRQYLDWLGIKLGLKSFLDWYKLTTRQFFEHAGGGLFVGMYGSSRLASL